mmetsp:Transcript_81086/g.262614  ORF Transcript_81086/g.262614 Transcript_81086/m.262614 type:complete len:253 (+) Transcript_81086:508-1266(+)
MLPNAEGADYLGPPRDHGEAEHRAIQLRGTRHLHDVLQSTAGLQPGNSRLPPRGEQGMPDGLLRLLQTELGAPRPASDLPIPLRVAVPELQRRLCQQRVVGPGHLLHGGVHQLPASLLQLLVVHLQSRHLLVLAGAVSPSDKGQLPQRLVANGDSLQHVLQVFCSALSPLSVGLQLLLLQERDLSLRVLQPQGLLLLFVLLSFSGPTEQDKLLESVQAVLFSLLDHLRGALLPLASLLLEEVHGRRMRVLLP